jgi:glyoxalase family protein
LLKPENRKLTMQLTGIHHLTAVTAHAAQNYQFYTEVLGMRLVKKTVNQDDVSAYHLFYADGEATPGTDLTFFDWPVGPERRGSNSIIRTGLRVGSEESLRWWLKRLDELGVRHGELEQRDGRSIVDFEDPEGQRLSLVNDAGQGEAHPWERSPVPAEHQIRGLGPITISVPRLESTDTVLTRVLNMRRVREYTLSDNGTPTVHVYEMGEGGPAAELHVAIEPGLPPAQHGAGGVHHVAFRAPTAEEHKAWADRLAELRIPSSGLVERYYFRSLYFREPNGILFELATDGPGFTADEPLESLGEGLALPPFLEPRRQEIEAGLKPLRTGR